MGGYCSQTRRFISPAIDFFTCLLIATHPSGNGSPALSTRHTNHVSPKSLLTGGEDEIVDQVNHEMALKRGEIEEIESDDEEEDEQEEDIGIGELRSLCEKVERLSLKYGDSETCLDLSRSLRQFRIQLRRVETAKARQTSLNEWFSSRESHDMSLLMSLSRFVTPIYTGINLIMHRKLALPGVMHYENFYCILCYSTYLLDISTFPSLISINGQNHAHTWAWLPTFSWICVNHVDIHWFGQHWRKLTLDAAPSRSPRVRSSEHIQFLRSQTMESLGCCYPRSTRPV